MRMIVDAFKDTLELGLEKPKQVVVRFGSLGSDSDPTLPYDGNRGSLRGFPCGC